MEGEQAVTTPQRKRAALDNELKQRGWTQAGAARELNRLGKRIHKEYQLSGDPRQTSATTVGNWVRGKSRPPAFWVEVLCRLFGKMPQELDLLEEDSAATPPAALLDAEPQPAFPAQEAADARPWVAPLDLAVLPQPPIASGLIGRDEDFHWLEACMKDHPDGGVWSISGLGGIGKTALVAWFLQQHVHQFPGGIAVLHLSGVLEAESILRRLVNKLVPSGDELLTEEHVTAESLRSALAGELTKLSDNVRPVLIVLDNVEPGLIPALRPLLEALYIGRAQVIVTSRDELPASLVSASRTLEDLSLPQASSLFTSLVPRLASTPLMPEDETQVQSICQEICAGHALALVLAAQDLAFHKWESLPEFRLRLEQPYALLDLIDDVGQPGSLRVFASTYTDLSPATQQVFVALGAFPSRSLPGGLIYRIGEAFGQSETQTKIHLGRLLHKYLIDAFPPPDSPPRFGLHPLVRQFASKLFDQWAEPEQDRVYQAAVRWYQPWIAQLSEQLYSGEGVSANDPTFIEALQADDANIHSLLRWLLRHIPETDQQLVSLLHPLRRYWWAQRRIEEPTTPSWRTTREQGIFWMTIGEAAAQRLGADWKRAQAGILYILGAMTSHRSTREAIEYYQRSLPFFRELQNQQAIAVTLQSLGECMLRVGDHQHAAAYFRERLALHRQLQNPKGFANALQGLGDVARRTGLTTRAYRLYRQSLTIRQKNSYLHGQAISMRLLGDIALRRGQLDQARKWYEASLPLRREVHDLRGEGITLRLLGNVTLHQGDVEQARQFYQEGLAIQKTIAGRQGEAITLRAIGDLELLQGNLEAAKASYEKSLELCRKVNEAQGEGKALRGLGDIARQQGQNKEALEHYQEALAIARRISDPISEAEALFRLGQLARQKSNDGDEEAMRYFHKALKLAHAAEAKLNELEILGEIGSLSETIRPFEAETWYQQALALAQTVSDQHAEQRLQAALLRMQGHQGEAG